MRTVKRIVLLGFLAAGCFNGHQIVTERAAREFRCPAGQVQTEDLGGNAYRVWACGSQATYACSPRLGMCMKEAGSVAASQAPMPEVAPTAPAYPTSGPPPFNPTPPAPAPAPPNPWETPQ